MSQRSLMRLCFFAIILYYSAVPAYAYKREHRVPLKGCNGYFSATGEAKSLEVKQEVKQKDREELNVDLKNVPMKPGTTLMVFIGDEEVGKIVLDEKRNGTLKLSSEAQKNIPMINPGSEVQIRTVGGRVVMK